MPNYDDDAISCGWTKKGSKWVHPDHPGEEFYNAKQIYPLLPCPPRRPLSATPREEPTPVAERVNTSPEHVIREMPKRGRPPKAVENKF